MAAFGFSTDESKIVDKFVNDTNERLKSGNLLKNPFNGGIRKLGTSHYAVSMTPIYFPFYWFGLLGVLMAYLFSGFTIGWWMLPGTLIFLLGIFYSPSFFYFMLRKGLRKAGYEGKVKRISKSDVINIFISSIY